MVRQSDTFFVASSYVPNDTDPSSGVDVSHRGGKPGFVMALDGTTIKWPDYVGKYVSHTTSPVKNTLNFSLPIISSFIFNTLGNIYKNPKCGLVFPDFDTGDVLQMTGEAVILFDDKSLPGAQRMVQFTVQEVRHTKAALPFKSHFLEYSTYSPEIECKFLVKWKKTILGIKLSDFDIVDQSLLNFDTVVKYHDLVSSLRDPFSFSRSPTTSSKD